MPLNIQNIGGSAMGGAGEGYEMAGGSTGAMGGTGTGGAMGGTTTTPTTTATPSNKIKPEQYLLIGAGIFVVVIIMYILIKK